MMDYSQNSTNDDPEVGAYRIDSIPHTTAAEERVLWRKYIKWRHTRRILGPESILDDLPKACDMVITQIIKEISSSQDLIVQIRRHAGLDKLGDTIIEDEENNANITVELYRLIQYSKKTHDEKTKQNRSEICCLEDLFGVLLGETLNNIAFGKGNPSLVDKITKALNEYPADIKDRLYSLAVNRDLLPRSTIKLFNPKIPLSKLPDSIKSIDPDFFHEFVSNYYQSFIINIKAEGKEAFNRIIESHLWLVVDIVDKYFIKDTGLPRDDSIQEGNLGLIEAAERFQPTRSARFMQYAHWWIFQKIYRAVADQARTVRTPAHMLESINRLLRTRLQLSQEYEREPTYTEIAEQMDISSDKVKEIIKVAQLPISLESPIGEEEDSRFGDFIEDRNALSPPDAASRQLLREQISEVLSTLTPREQRVLQLRFGLEDGRSRTLEEVGREFNVTRERIRQIEAKALRRLRHPSRSQKLKEYLE